MADDTAPTEGATDAPATGDENPELGEKGEKALTAMKEQVKTLRAEARKAKELEAEVAKLREANQTEAEKALNAAKAEGRTEAEAEIGKALTTARVELAVLKSDAAKNLADPSDALAFIDTDDVLVNGQVDDKALAKAITALLERKPHLAATAPTPKVPNGPRNGDRPAASDMNTLIRGGLRGGQG